MCTIAQCYDCDKIEFMILVKKLIFAPAFLIVFFIFISQLSPFFKSYDFIFSLSLETLVQLTIISLLISLSSLLFVIFATIALDWRITLPVAILASLSPLIFLDQALGIILGVGVLVSFIIANLSLENNMKTYLTFQPLSILGPPTRHLAGFLILVIAICYFLAVNKIITQNGFQIPDSLIDAALKFTPAQSEQAETQLQPAISAEQVELLKQNPDLLKQYGLDPKILDSLTKPQESSQTPQSFTDNLLKQTVKDQLDNFLKPYLPFIPATLAILLFLTLQSLTSLINLLIYPLIWLIFFILEKSEFVKFTEEMRPVRKMVL